VHVIKEFHRPETGAFLGRQGHNASHQKVPRERKRESPGRQEVSFSCRKKCQFICLFDFSNAACLDCGKHVTSRRSHLALCGRKTVECAYPSPTVSGNIIIMLRRVNGRFTCWRCGKVLKKDSSMRVHSEGNGLHVICLPFCYKAHARECTTAAATAGVFITEREAPDSVTADRVSPSDCRNRSPVSSTPRPRAMNQNSGLSNVVASSCTSWARDIITKPEANGIIASAGDQVYSTTKPIGPGSNANRLTTSPTPHPQTGIEVPSRDTFSAATNQEEMSCNTSFNGDEEMEMDLLGCDLFDDEV
jgi:hypothetical protein